MSNTPANNSPMNMNFFDIVLPPQILGSYFNGETVASHVR
jgi:hypothetical protein